MALKAVLENVDDLPENIREEYFEKDGKFYLDFDGDSYKEHPSILPLANALKNVKDEKRTLSAENAELKTKVAVIPENFDANEYERLRTEEEKRKADPKYAPNADERVQQAKQQYESQIKHMRDEYERQLAEAESRRSGEVGERDRELEDILLDQGLSRALDEAGVDPKFKPAVSALLKPSGRVFRDEETKKRRAVIETDLGEEEIDKFVANWSRSDAGRHYVVKPTGGGASGSSGGGRSSEVNPWVAATRNLTQQGVILRTDKGKAERLMLASGMSAAEVKMKLGGASAA